MDVRSSLITIFLLPPLLIIFFLDSKLSIYLSIYKSNLKLGKVFFLFQVSTLNLKGKQTKPNSKSQSALIYGRWSFASPFLLSSSILREQVPFMFLPMNHMIKHSDPTTRTFNVSCILFFPRKWWISLKQTGICLNFETHMRYGVPLSTKVASQRFLPLFNSLVTNSLIHQKAIAATIKSERKSTCNNLPLCLKILTILFPKMIL